MDVCGTGRKQLFIWEGKVKEHIRTKRGDTDIHREVRSRVSDSESSMHVVLCLKQEESKYSHTCKLVMHLYCIVYFFQGLTLIFSVCVSGILQTEMRKGESCITRVDKERRTNPWKWSAGSSSLKRVADKGQGKRQDMNTSSEVVSEGVFIPLWCV